MSFWLRGRPCASLRSGCWRLVCWPKMGPIMGRISPSWLRWSQKLPRPSRPIRPRWKPPPPRVKTNRSQPAPTCPPPLRPRPHPQPLTPLRFPPVQRPHLLRHSVRHRLPLTNPHPRQPAHGRRLPRPIPAPRPLPPPHPQPVPPAPRLPRPAGQRQPLRPARQVRPWLPPLRLNHPPPIPPHPYPPSPSPRVTHRPKCRR